MADHNILGLQGENLASEYLFSSGYLVLFRNWRFKKAEIDIIAQKDNVFIFVEVKTRRYVSFGSPEESISLHKEMLLIDAATQFILDSKHEGEIRFDIISIVINKDNSHSLVHYKDAFFPSI